MNIFEFLFHRGNDLTTQFLPDAMFFKESLLKGQFPFWNPWIFAGMPYLLDPQNLLWYPPNYLLLLLPVETAFLVLLVGHLVFAGWMVKKVLAEFSAKSGSAFGGGVFGKLGVLGGLMFVFSPKLMAHIEEGNWSLVIAACWLPMLYWALRKKKFWWTVISLSAIIINNLNTGYYAVLFAILYLVITKRTVLGRTILLKLAKVMALVLSITIPRWLPLVLFGNQTARALLQETPLPLWSWTKIAKSMFYPLTSGHPYLQNEEILYIGLIPLLVFGAFLMFRYFEISKHYRRVNFWIIWLIFILLVVLNLKTPFFPLLKLLPGFSLLRITTRPWIFASLAVALAVPVAIGRIGGMWGKKRAAKILTAVLSSLIVMEYFWFDWRIFSRRQIAPDPVPVGFYQRMIEDGTPVRAYCTTGCLNRLTAQKMGIALLGGNNPVQLTAFVRYLERAGGYLEPAYHPILPPYTVFSGNPQPNAELLAQTATKFVVSPYELTDNTLKVIDQKGDYLLYVNTAKMAETKDHYFELY